MTASGAARRSASAAADQSLQQLEARQQLCSREAEDEHPTRDRKPQHASPLARARPEQEAGEAIHGAELDLEQKALGESRQEGHDQREGDGHVAVAKPLSGGTLDVDAVDPEAARNCDQQQQGGKRRRPRSVKPGGKSADSGPG
jgi:hypothetical protein